MTTVLVLPAAGTGSRLDLPYPKEAFALAPGNLLVDSSLRLAREAGVTSAVVVTSVGKLKPLVAALGMRRHGLYLRYVDKTARGKSHLSTDAGSIVRGASLALSALGATTVVVAYPDCLYGHEDTRLNDKVLLELLEAADGKDAFAVYENAPESPLAVFGAAGYRRLARLEQSMPKDTSFAAMLAADAAHWARLEPFGWTVDVDTWDKARAVFELVSERRDDV